MKQVSGIRLFLVGGDFFRNAGGIQQVNCNLARVFTAPQSATLLETSIFSLLDPSASIPKLAGSHFGYGAQGSRWKLALALLGRAFRQRPDLVLFTHPRLLSLAPLLRMISRRTKIAVLCHGAEVWQALPTKLQRELQRADHLVTPSEFTRARLIDLQRVDPARVVVIPHGLPPEWAVRQMLRRSGDSIRLLTVCRMSRDDARYGSKGIDQLLEAMVIFRETHPSAALSIVGEGDDRARLQTKSANLGLGDSVQFLGPASDEQLHEQLAGADIFVLPSNLEGFGLVFLEAMSYGLPVVALNAAATPEVVEDGRTGVLTLNNSVRELCSAIASLQNDGKLRMKMGLQAQELVRSRFLFKHFQARWTYWLQGALCQESYIAKHSQVFVAIGRVARKKDAA